MMNEKKTGVPRKPRGTSRSQTMMCFRLDNDLLDYVKVKPNKAMYFNTLVREDVRRHS